MAIFGLIWTQFRSKQLKIWPGNHFCSQIHQRSLRSKDQNRIAKCKILIYLKVMLNNVITPILTHNIIILILLFNVIIYYIIYSL